MIRLRNDKLGRALHNPIYERCIAFAEKYTPEFPADIAVSAWMNRVYADDPAMHVIITLDNSFAITEHAVIEVQEVYGHKVVVAHQVYRSKPQKGFFEEGVQYVEALSETERANCSVFSASEHVKAIERKYGYTATRTLMVKFYEWSLLRIWRVLNIYSKVFFKNSYGVTDG